MVAHFDVGNSSYSSLKFSGFFLNSIAHCLTHKIFSSKLFCRMFKQLLRFFIIARKGSSIQMIFKSIVMLSNRRFTTTNSKIKIVIDQRTIWYLFCIQMTSKDMKLKRMKFVGLIFKQLPLGHLVPKTICLSLFMGSIFVASDLFFCSTIFVENVRDAFCVLSNCLTKVEFEFFKLLLLPQKMFV